MAPHYLRHRIQDLIAQETSYGSPGRIVFKLNSLIDTAMIDSLYAASQAGRADRPHHPGHLRPAARAWRACRRRSGSARSSVATSSTPGSTAFGNGTGPGETAYYIGSADLMPRNLDKRVEVCAPVERPELQRRLQEVLEVCLDRRRAVLGAAARTGRGSGATADGGVETQRRLYELNQARARRAAAGG